MASSQLLALLCVIAAAVVQVHGMEVWPVDGYTQEDLHEAVQDHLGPAISLLDVTTIEEAEEVGDRKFSDEQREIGELRVRKFAADMIGEVEEDEAKSNAQRSLLFALDPWGLEQGEGADPKKKEKTSEDKKAEQRATEKGEERGEGGDRARTRIEEEFCTDAQPNAEHGNQ